MSLTDELAAILAEGRDVTAFARIAGFAVQTMQRALESGRFDRPTHWRAELSLDVATAAALRMADKYDGRAARLRAWAHKAQAQDDG